MTSALSAGAMLYKLDEVRSHTVGPGAKIASQTALFSEFLFNIESNSALPLISQLT